jgi:hypothetical protein
MSSFFAETPALVRISQCHYVDPTENLGTAANPVNAEE